MSDFDPIVSAKRTPLGRFVGDLAPLKAPQLAAISAALASIGLALERVNGRPDGATCFTGGAGTSAGAPGDALGRAP